MKKTRRISIAVGLAIVAVLGGTAAAEAATVTTSISQWYKGSAGAWRKANSGVNQSLDFTSTCYWAGSAAPTPDYAQMQLQQYNGIYSPIAHGNRDVGCWYYQGAQTWGTVAAGAQFRYQLNGVKISGRTGLQDGPFSVSSVVIKY